MGSIDPNYCVQLGLGLHLKRIEILRNEHNSPLLFGMIKRRVRTLFEKITLQDIFHFTSPNPIGTHSIRKLPAIYPKRNGCSKDDVDAMERWNSNKRIVDTYIDNLIPFPDAVVSTLCIGGPVKYAMREEFSNLINGNLILVKYYLLIPNTSSFSIRPCDFVGSFYKEMSKIIQPNIVD